MVLRTTYNERQCAIRSKSVTIVWVFPSASVITSIAIDLARLGWRQLHLCQLAVLPETRDYHCCVDVSTVQ